MIGAYMAFVALTLSQPIEACGLKSDAYHVALFCHK